MFNIYISQRGLDSIACGVMLGAIMYDNESNTQYLQAKNIQVNSLKADKLISSIGGNYTANYDHVPFEFSELDMMRKIRYQLENLVYSLTSKLSIQLKDCRLILDSSLPKLTIGNTLMAKSAKKYPLLHMTKLLIESERRRFNTQLNIIYPKYKFNVNQGRISPNHIDGILRHRVSKVHRPRTIELVTDYLVKLYQGDSPRRDNYIIYFQKRLPWWWQQYYLVEKNIEMRCIRDLIPLDRQRKIVKIIRPLDAVYHPKTYRNKTMNSEDYKWFEQHAPIDLKYEILL